MSGVPEWNDRSALTKRRKRRTALRQDKYCVSLISRASSSVPSGKSRTHAPSVSAYRAFAIVDARCMWFLSAQKRCSETPEMSTRVAQPLTGVSWCSCGTAEQRGSTNWTMCCGRQTINGDFREQNRSRPRTHLVQSHDPRLQPRRVFRVRVRLLFRQTGDLEDIDGQAGLVPPAGPLRVQLPRHLKLRQRELVVQLVDVLGSAPVLARGELGVRALDVELARAEEAAARWGIA